MPLRLDRVSLQSTRSAEVLKNLRTNETQKWVGLRGVRGESKVKIEGPNRLAGSIDYSEFYLIFNRRGLDSMYLVRLILFAHIQFPVRDATRTLSFCLKIKEFAFVISSIENDIFTACPLRKSKPTKSLLAIG